MGVSLMGMARSQRALAVGAAGLALFAASAVGAGSGQPVSASSCADVELQAAGAPTLSGCGVSRLRANPRGTDEAHFATSTNRAVGVTEAQQPRANAHLGRAGRNAAPGNGTAAASLETLPPRKTIDLTNLPTALVSPPE